MCYVTEAAKRYLADHMAEVDTIADLAEALHLAPETLRKKFRQEEGSSLGRYIMAQKVTRARHLLETTSLTCAEVCYAVGWRPDSGARRFKRMTGETMTAYRQGRTGRPVWQGWPTAQVWETFKAHGAALRTWAQTSLLLLTQLLWRAD